MKLTDNELCMLEQLTYLDEDVSKMANAPFFSMNDKKGLTIEQILSGFDEEALEKLESEGTNNIGYVSAKEWAEIIRYLKNSRMKDLVLDDMMFAADSNSDKESQKTPFALCFIEEGKSEEAVVAFKGTTGTGEWEDNVNGLNVSDTACQKEAFNYIESLPYNDITVTGHSKGANKAMYVAVKSDKVNRCVAYDGQGFSQEFIDKYWAEIQAKGHTITEYSLSTDFVHVLLFPVPNAKQVYCKGYGVSNSGENHSPNSFFKTDALGNLVLDNNGNPIVVEVLEDESMVMLHEFTTFVLNNASDCDKKKIAEYLSVLAGIMFKDEDNNVKLDKTLKHVFSDQDSLALVLAYLVKYMDEYNLDSDDIDKLLKALGLDCLNELITIKEYKLPNGKILVNVNLANILNFIKKQLTDDNDDFIITKLLELTGGWIKDGASKMNIEIGKKDVANLWRRTNEYAKQIDTSGGRSNAIAREGIIRDFSLKTYNAIVDSINRIESIGSESVSSWNQYAGEEWYSSLLIHIAVKGINTYFLKLSETNKICRTKVDIIFDGVEVEDSTMASKLEKGCEKLRNAGKHIAEVSANISIV